LIFSHIGRMNKAKNHLQLIDIFFEFLKAKSNSHLFLIGKEDKDIAALINSKIKHLEIEDKINILGQKSNVYQYLKQTNCMIYPSIREGLPGAILEAMVCGVPVVASDIKPNLELGSFFSNIKCISLQESPSMWVSDIIDILRY